MWKGIEEKGLDRPLLSPQEMADVVAHLFSTRYFDEPGDPNRGKNTFNKKQCHHCHTRGTPSDLTALKGQISPIFMAQTMWNHGPQMLEKMRKVKASWQKIDGQEMVDLMEYLNRGMP
jgi:cytochrome c